MTLAGIINVLVATHPKIRFRSSCYPFPRFRSMTAKGTTPISDKIPVAFHLDADGYDLPEETLGVGDI